MFRCYNDEWEEYISRCGFTDDELEIVKFLRKGWAQADIAAELCISLSTLKRRVKRIYLKIIYCNFSRSEKPTC